MIRADVWFVQKGDNRKQITSVVRDKNGVVTITLSAAEVEKIKNVKGLRLGLIGAGRGTAYATCEPQKWFGNSTPTLAANGGAVTEERTSVGAPGSLDRRALAWWLAVGDTERRKLKDNPLKSNRTPKRVPRR